MGKSTLQKIRKNKTAYLYILPAMLVVLLVSFGPILYGLSLSTLNMNLNTMGEKERVNEVREKVEIFTEIKGNLAEFKDTKNEGVLEDTSAYIDKRISKKPRLSLQNDKVIKDLKIVLDKKQTDKIDLSITKIDRKLDGLEKQRIVLFDNWISKTKGALTVAKEKGDTKEAEKIQNEISTLQTEKENGGYYKPIKFVGIDNFVRALGNIDAEFIKVLVRTLVWTVVNVFFHVFIGLTLALLLNRKGLRFKKFYRGILILPWAVPQLVTALIWKYLFHSEFGFINQVLSSIAGHQVLIPWLTTPTLAFISVVVVNVWLGVPFMMMIATGALQSIPEDIYEAADIDGATPSQKLFNITLPLLKPAMVPSVVVGTIWTFTNFNVVYLLTKGGPTKSTEIISTYTFNAIKGGLYSYASAYAIITFIILLMLTLINFKVSKSFEKEGA